MPLGVDFVPHRVGTREWFTETDRIKKNHGLLGCLHDWAPTDIRGKRVLDVGCGPGFWARLLIPMGAIYSGVDISPRSVALANRSLALFGLKGSIQVGNAEALDFPDGHFDRVISEGVIHHSPDTQACIDEIHRVLKPGGLATVSVYYRVYPLRSTACFRLAKAAMRVVGLIQTGRGRETMVDASTPEEFVRLYDGKSNPIGKAYTRPELRAAFRRFSKLAFKRYFLPYSRPILMLPKAARRILSRLGLMIMVSAEK